MFVISKIMPLLALLGARGKLQSKEMFGYLQLQKSGKRSWKNGGKVVLQF